MTALMNLQQSGVHVGDVNLHAQALMQHLLAEESTHVFEKGQLFCQQCKHVPYNKA